MHVFTGANGQVEYASGSDQDCAPASPARAVLAIGNFDGVHKGHQALLATAISSAQKHGCTAGAMTFEPHPVEFLKPDQPHFRLTPLKEKLHLFENIGLDLAVVMRFDRTLVKLSADDFASTYLSRALSVRHVVVGYDFYYGHKRSGDPDTLRRQGNELGFEVTVVEPQSDGGEPYSSSVIRNLLRQGQVKEAADALGHQWRVTGTVVSGAKLGSELGFPTANIELPAGTDLGHGIYAARVYVGCDRYDAAAYFGARPTVAVDAPALLEVFLLDFDGDLYGREISVEFVAHVREDRKFADVEAMKVQMLEDCQAARRAIEAASGQ